MGARAVAARAVPPEGETVGAEAVAQLLWAEPYITPGPSGFQTARLRAIQRLEEAEVPAEPRGPDLMLDWEASVARGLRARELACIARRPRLQPSRTAPSRAILQAVATAHRAALSQMASGATARAGATAWVRASAALAQAL